MKPIFEQAKLTPKRVVYAEGENEKVLRAIQEILSGGLAKPILIGRKDIIQSTINELGLSINLERDVEIIEPDNNPYFEECAETYHKAKERKGVSIALAKNYVRTKNTVLASLLVKLGKADSMICGMVGNYHRHLGHITDILDKKPGVEKIAAMSVVVIPKGVYFFCDTMVNRNPNTDDLVAMTLQAAECVKRFGIEPKAAMLSHSNFGSDDDDEARKMANAARILHEKHPHLEVEGEIQADAALLQELRKEMLGNSKLEGSANLLVFPNLDAANTSFNLLRILSDGISLGPILLGIEKPVHVLKPLASIRRILNMTALCSAEHESTTNK